MFQCNSILLISHDFRLKIKNLRFSCFKYHKSWFFMLFNKYLEYKSCCLNSAILRSFNWKLIECFLIKSSLLQLSLLAELENTASSKFWTYSFSRRKIALKFKIIAAERSWFNSVNGLLSKKLSLWNEKASKVLTLSRNIRDARSSTHLHIFQIVACSTIELWCCCCMELSFSDVGRTVGIVWLSVRPSE